MAKIEKLWFEANRIYLLTDSGFSRFPQINVSEMAKYIGINKSLLAKYIYGIKKPSAKRMLEIKQAFHLMGQELIAI